MNELTLQIDSVQSGWADLTLFFGEHEYAATISSAPGDSLAELAHSAIRALDGQGSHIIFSLEPDELHLHVEPTDDDQVRVRADNYLAAVVPSTKYARAVLRTFSQVLRVSSLGDYEAGWQHSFPSGAIRYLKERMRNHR